MDTKKPSDDLEQLIGDDEELLWVSEPDATARLLSNFNPLEFLMDETEYAATDKRLIKYSGTFGRDLDSVPVEKVQDAEFDVSTVESFFDVGTVTIDTDRGVERMYFSFVSDPASFATEVNEVVQGAAAEE